MRNPFPDNEVFQKFLGLKFDFRKYVTSESLERFKTFVRIARIIQQSGDKISFDLLGSVNFGMATEQSDTDIVIYLEADHFDEADFRNTPNLKFYETLLLTSLVQEYSLNKFKIQVVDCINLKRLELAIKNEDFEDDIIARFVFYRTICRGVNKKIIRPYEKMIMDKKELFKKIEMKLTDALIEFTRTSGHALSFRKYLSRLRDKNVTIPISMAEKIVDYLNLSS